MKLIVGLGNPGKEYEKTRHNVGFIILDQLQKELQFESFKTEKKFQAQISVGAFSNEKVILVKPLTYMNLSGESLQKIIQFYKVSFQDLLVIYDDLDLPFGQIRIRMKGSAGTHNGMKSIVKLLGSENFPRVRFGIESRGVETSQKQETSSFVLSRFTSEEEKVLQEKSLKILEAIKIFLKDGTEAAMNKFNG